MTPEEEARQGRQWKAMARRENHVKKHPVNTPEIKNATKKTDGPRRDKVLGYLQKHGAVDRNAVARDLGLVPDTVSSDLSRLRQYGLVVGEARLWRALEGEEKKLAGCAETAWR